MSVARNSVYNLLGFVIPLAISLVTIPIYLALVGIERYGVLAIAWIFLGYFGLFDLGLGRATTQRIAVLVSATRQQRADTFWTAVVLNIAIGLIGAVALWIGAYFFFKYGFKLEPALRTEALEALPLLALSVPIATATGVLSGALQGRERFASTNLVSTISTAAFQIVPLIVVAFTGPRLIYVLAAAILTRLLGLVAFWIECNQEFLAGTSAHFKREEVRSLLAFGGWVTVTAMAGPVLVMVDRVAVGVLIGPQAVATYSFAIQLALRMTMVAQAVIGATYPRLSGADRDEANRITARSVMAIIAIMSPVSVIAIFGSGPFFRLWLGADFDPITVPIAQIMIIAFWINSLSLTPFVRLQAVGRPDLVSYVLLLELPFYLPLLWVSMTLMGLIGCAIAMAIRIVCEYALLAWFARQFAAPWLTAVMLALLLGAFAIAPHDGGFVWLDIALALLGMLASVGIAIAFIGLDTIMALVPARFRRIGAAR